MQCVVGVPHQCGCHGPLQSHNGCLVSPCYPLRQCQNKPTRCVYLCNLYPLLSLLAAELVMCYMYMYVSLVC